MCVIEREKWKLYYPAFWWNGILWNCKLLYNNHTLNVTVCSGIIFQLIAVETIVLKLFCCWQNSAVAVLFVTSPLVWRDLLHTKREDCMCVRCYCTARKLHRLCSNWQIVDAVIRKPSSMIQLIPEQLLHKHTLPITPLQTSYVSVCSPP